LGGTGGTGGTGTCNPPPVTTSRIIPNVMFLVDQSGSMTDDFAGQPRWTAAHSAITSIVDDLDSIVRFGLTTYTSDDGDVNPPCPELPTQVDFAIDNSVTIGNATVYPPNYPGGEDTPTGDSIDALVSIIQSNPPPEEGPTIIVLATDGLPDSCEIPDPSNDTERAETENEAVTAAENAFDNAGIQTFILSVGPEVTDSHLQEVANVGVGLPRGTTGPGAATFWKAINSDQLTAAFNQIIRDSISCDIEINKPFDDVDIACSQGDVRLNGNPLSCPSGDWQVKSGVNNVIELLGGACSTFKSGDVTFTAVFPCGAIVVE
jgi:hypothetical protein